MVHRYYYPNLRTNEISTSYYRKIIARSIFTLHGILFGGQVLKTCFSNETNIFLLETMQILLCKLLCIIFHPFESLLYLIL